MCLYDGFGEGHILCNADELAKGVYFVKIEIGKRVVVVEKVIVN